MRRVLIGAALVGTGALLARALGPELRRRCASRCVEMFDSMPEELPPKRMMRTLDEVRDQTGRILRLLEERESSAADR